jgi:uncharacterized iron-regulated protein
MSRRLLVSAFLVVAFTVPSLAQAPIVAHRVFATAQGGFADLAAMVDDLATADVVFVGEQHNDDNTHRFAGARDVRTGCTGAARALPDGTYRRG